MNPEKSHRNPDEHLVYVGNGLLESVSNQTHSPCQKPLVRQRRVGHHNWRLICKACHYYSDWSDNQK